MSQQGREDQTRLFRALSVEKRLGIVRLLSERTLCVGALSNRLGISAGAVSQHLRILKDAGLVEPDRRGYFVHYSLAPGAVERCRAAVDTLFGADAGTPEGGRKCVAERASVKGRKS